MSIKEKIRATIAEVMEDIDITEIIEEILWENLDLIEDAIEQKVYEYDFDTFIKDYIEEEN